jgi:hypothetical protein
MTLRNPRASRLWKYGVLGRLLMRRPKSLFGVLVLLFVASFMLPAMPVAVQVVFLVVVCGTALGLLIVKLYAVYARYREW